jgi:hypothetical protein
MTDVVVDTNVIATANATETEYPACVASCATFLNGIKRGRRYLLDDVWEILTEYTRNASSSGQPGPGDAFLRWVLTTHAGADYCRKVQITPDETRGYAEFPDTDELETFDASDRKFVAVAVSAAPDSAIAVALDRGWWNHREALGAAGVQVEHVCEDDLREIAERRT